MKVTCKCNRWCALIRCFAVTRVAGYCVLNTMHKTRHLPSFLGLFPSFQCCTRKRGKAWYQRSREQAKGGRRVKIIRKNSNSQLKPMHTVTCTDRTWCCDAMRSLDRATGSSLTWFVIPGLPHYPHATLNKVGIGLGTNYFTCYTLDPIC